ncbi:uncharacterized protein [Venturia canescens]|uniref:uncharacterized protein isoform X3 n=1 Tax=Venturia canescens TaxID=32260 RepID=UPI001C9C8548|nr:uncharacterized protein LOC122418251 isoform X3 [Venturia canescens]
MVFLRINPLNNRYFVTNGKKKGPVGEIVAKNANRNVLRLIARNLNDKVPYILCELLDNQQLRDDETRKLTVSQPTHNIIYLSNNDISCYETVESSNISNEHIILLKNDFSGLSELLDNDETGNVDITTLENQIQICNLDMSPVQLKSTEVKARDIFHASKVHITEIVNESSTEIFYDYAKKSEATNFEQFDKHETKISSMSTDQLNSNSDINGNIECSNTNSSNVTNFKKLSTIVTEMCKIDEIDHNEIETANDPISISYNEMSPDRCVLDSKNMDSDKLNNNSSKMLPTNGPIVTSIQILTDRISLPLLGATYEQSKSIKAKADDSSQELKRSVNDNIEEDLANNVQSDVDLSITSLKFQELNDNVSEISDNDGISTITELDELDNGTISDCDNSFVDDDKTFPLPSPEKIRAPLDTSVEYPECDSLERS